MSADELPALDRPQKPIQHFTLGECMKCSREYFPEPIVFKKRAHLFFCCDVGTGRVWGEGNSYGASFVDAISKMELRKARAREEHAAIQVKKAATFKRLHPVRHFVRTAIAQIAGGGKNV
jgi:hypothetical protein